ncbi:MAG: hypothetical protein M3394_06795 [Actinomycetota bacterium]|nr:hypothetical protein [Actinomycetota bacterium]
MAVTEHGRFVLYRHFEAEMGEDKARTLMDHLLPVGWTDLATKHELREVANELAQLRDTVATKADLAAVRAELAIEIAGVRTEVADLRTDLRTEIADLRSEMYKGFTSLTLTLVATMVGLQGLLLAGLKLL